MAQKISALSSGAPALTTDIIPVARGSGNNRLTLNNVAQLTISKLMFSVKEYGALGDGSTDDTASIRTCIAAAVSNGGGLVYFPVGTYIVGATAVGGTILNITGANVHIQGAGRAATKIKVKNSATAYKYVFSGVTGSEFTTDMTGLEIEGITIDHNIANNVVTGYATNNYMDSIGVFTGTDISIHDCSFINSSGVNMITCNGGSMARVNISRNLFTGNGDDNSHTVHDVSVIYTHGTDVVIANNIIQATTANSPSAVTGIEIHNSRHVVIGNQIHNYATGILVTGISAADTQNVVVEGNTIDGCTIGVYLWSTTYSTHTTGYGLDGLTIANNTIRLSGLSTYASVGVEYGIAVSPQANDMDITNLNITGNTIYHPLEGSSVTNNTVSLGIGWYSTVPKTLSNARIVNNTIVNFPMAGIRFWCNLTNVVIAHNTLINCGSTLDAAITNAAYKTPILIAAPTTISNVTINDNTISDTNATSRIIYYLYLYQPASLSANNIFLLDNVFIATGATQTSIVNQVFMDNTTPGAMQPYMRGSIRGFLPTSSSFQKYAIGSTVVDPTNSLIYEIAADGYTWNSRSTRLAAAVPTWSAAHIWTPTSNSTSTLKVTQADATIVFNIDTTNKRVGVGVAAPAQQLNVMGGQSPVTGNLGTLTASAIRISTESAAAVGTAAELQLGGRTTSGTMPIGAISAILSSNTTGTGQVGDMAFSTHALVADSTLTESMRITKSGTLLIGKTVAASTDAVGNVEINGSLRLGAAQVWAVGTALPATTGTMTATMDGGIKTITPTGACTFNATGGVTGQRCAFYITTSGTSSYVMTFGTNMVSTGTLATGTVSGKVFVVVFVCKDGTTWAEVSRTTAM